MPVYPEHRATSYSPELDRKHNHQISLIRVKEGLKQYFGEFLQHKIRL